MASAQAPMELPKGKADKRSASQIFDAHAEYILAEWQARTAHPPSRRAESANAWFKRSAYRLIKHYIENDLQSIFKRNPELDRRSNRLIEDAKKNPFKLGLMAMFFDDNSLSRSNRHVFGNQMLYAWAHDVPEDFLNAFLAISGGPAAIASKLKNADAEPGFAHRFRAERLP